MSIARRSTALAFSTVVLAATALAGTTGAALAQGERTYEVTIVNMAPGQPIAPPVVLLYVTRGGPIFLGGEADGSIRQLAENGDGSVWVGDLGAVPDVLAVATGEAPIVASGVPGAALYPGFAKFELTGGKKAKFIGVMGMLMCTNDGFAVLADGGLPKKVGQIRVYEAKAFDAGTEMNTEDLADMVPQCQDLVGISSPDQGTADSDDNIAEGGGFKPHPGIAGGTDLDPEIHAVASVPALVIVERTS